MSDIFCRISQMSVTYGRGSKAVAALRNVDLDILSGERLDITGDSR